MKDKTLPTRVYTPGLPAAAQPSPHDTIPMSLLLESTRGPPLSPWQESLPPDATPAQIILSVMVDSP